MFGRYCHFIRYTCEIKHISVQQLCHKFYFYKDNNVQFWLTLSEMYSFNYMFITEATLYWNVFQ